MIPQATLTTFKEYLEHAENPLFFFDDDADGVSSFILCYEYQKKGSGIIINKSPRLTTYHLNLVQKHQSDLIVILDLAEVDQAFLDGCNCPVIWMDHHAPQERTKVFYLNPMMYEPKDNTPVTYWCYKMLGGRLWIATLGSIADWYMPDFLDAFREQYPHLLEQSVHAPDEALFNSQFSLLFRIYSFNFKGTATQAMRSVKLLLDIKEPNEILQQTSSAGKRFHQKYEKVNEEYEEILHNTQIVAADFMLVVYKHKTFSFTSDISNYLVSQHKKAFICVARLTDGEYRCSLRSTHHDVLTILNKSLIGINGFGGGHKAACGCCIKTEDFDKFIENLKKNISQE